MTEDTLFEAETAVETAVEGPAPPAEEAQPEPKQDKGTEARKRIAKLTYEREEARRQSAVKDEIIAQLRGGQPAQPSIDAQVEARAEALAAEKKFNDECNRTYAKGLKEFPDFAESVRAFDDIGGLGGNVDFLDALNSLPNGHAVLRELAENLDDASDLLSMKPAKMALKLAEISGGLAKPNPKPLSKAPPPPESVNGRPSAASKDPEKMDMTEFAAWRAEARKKAGH